MKWKVQHATNDVWERVEAPDAVVTECGALVFGEAMILPHVDRFRPYIRKVVAAYAPGYWIRFKTDPDKEDK